MLPQERKTNRILVIGLMGIGNLIMFLPCARALKKRYPEAIISLLTYRNGAKALFERQGCYDEIIEFDRSKWMGRDAANERIKDLIKFLKIIYWSRKNHFDLLIWPTLPASDIKRGLIVFILGAKRRVGYLYSSGINNILARMLFNINLPAENNLHDIEQNALLLQHIGIYDIEQIPDLILKPNTDFIVDNFFVAKGISPKKLLICIHPGGHTMKRPLRSWMLERYGALCVLLEKHWGAHIILLGSDSEKRILENIANYCANFTATIVSDLSLYEAAAVIKRCDLFIGNDSGLMHIAAALGIPTIGIFGPTDYNRTGPRGIKTAIIRKPIKCSPCWNKKYGKQCINRRCFTDLSAEEVFNKIENLGLLKQSIQEKLTI